MNEFDEFTWQSRFRKWLIAHFAGSALYGLIITIFIWKTIFGGDTPEISFGRILYLLIVMSVEFLLLIISLYLLKNSKNGQKVWDIVFGNKKKLQYLFRFSYVIFLLFWILFFYPPYQVPEAFSLYLSSFKPVFLWIMLFFSSLYAALFFNSSEWLNQTIDKTLFWFIGMIGIPAILFFVMIKKTGLGIAFQEDYWYGAGVPLLWFQIVISVLIGLIFSWVIERWQFIKKIARFDLFVFISIWLITAFFWAKEPLQPSHFMPSNSINPFYPYSDSAIFDIGSQFALIGQGLFNGQYFDRSLYSSFLTYLHILIGQETARLMVVQSILYAVFPAILYLLGREIHGPVLGVSFASAIMLRGINAISGTSLIDMAGPKMMLTDFPTAIGVSLITLFVLKWIHSPQKISNVVWVGCFIGLTMLLRTHVIFLLPFLLVYFFAIYKRRKSYLLYGSLFLILGMFVSTLPFEIQNRQKGIPLFYIYYSRIQEVLKARYGISSESSIEDKNEKRLTLLAERQRESLSNNDIVIGCESKLCSIGNHFFHNLITAVLYFPTSFALDDFRYTVTESAPYWEKNWIGDGVSRANYLLLSINLFFISIGIWVAWKRSRLSGLFPLMIFFVYILANAFALTSGGRYIVPVDWIICLYYMIGILKLFYWSLHSIVPNLHLHESNPSETSDLLISPRPILFRKSVESLLLVFMIGSLIPLTDSLFPRRYQEATNEDVLVTLDQAGLLAEAGLTYQLVSEFLETSGGDITIGKLLYPRFYPSNKGELGLDYPYTTLNYRRLAFMVIGPFNVIEERVIFPSEKYKAGLHASDVIILGCKNELFFDALVVFILSEPKQVYIRPTGLTMQCPLPNPQ